MPRIKLSDEERRRTVAFTMPGKNVKEFDEIVKNINDSIPFTAGITRASVLEHITMDFIRKNKDKSRPQ